MLEGEGGDEAGGATGCEVGSGSEGAPPSPCSPFHFAMHGSQYGSTKLSFWPLCTLCLHPCAPLNNFYAPLSFISLHLSLHPSSRPADIVGREAACVPPARGWGQLR